jgi:glyoxylase-like metal-dependent hydrolase (beta-lactamase superfamily II)
MSPHDGGNAALSFPHGVPPEGGTIIEVAPGVRWLRMPLPFALNHINLWLLADGEGWAIVDTGVATPETRELWERLFATALDGKPVTRVIVTHFHPDHMGLAGWLTERHGVALWVSETEWLYARMLSLDPGGEASARNARAFYEAAGLAGAELSALVTRGSDYRHRVSPIPLRFRRLADGMVFAIGGRSWRVIIGRGHAPEHACLDCPELGVLISGDQVLPKITPNVSLWPQEADGNPLALFIASLHKLRREVPAGRLVLPSHGLPFYGLDIRLGQLLAHHDARLAEVEAACETPQTTAELVPVLFRRKLDTHQLGFALGETLAHVHYLLGEERLRRRRDADGADRFVRA